MLEIHWRGNIGYGDFVTGLGYANNCAIKWNTGINITFFWEHSKDFKYDKTDPETIVGRCNYYKEVIKMSSDVKVKHQYNTKLPYRFLNQLHEFNPLHGLGYFENVNETSIKKAVIWSSLWNKEEVSDDKDPAKIYWYEIKNKLIDSGYAVSEITYRTPIAEVIRHVKECSLGVGYDGMIHQIFKHAFKPCIIFCKRKDLNRLLVPQAILIDDPNLFLKKDIGVYEFLSHARCVSTQHKYNTWLNEKENPTEHRLFNTPIY